VSNIRKKFAETAFEIAKNDKKIVVTVADISHGLFKSFREKFPKRYYNIGICEQGMVNLAAGLAKSGLNPIVHTIAPFITERAYEQIKLDFGYQKEGINLVSIGGSFDYSKLGCTHHCYTDISLFSHFKNSIIIIPGSEEEFSILFKKVYKKKLIKYFKIPNKSHLIPIKKKEIKLGKAVKLTKGKDLTIAVTGTQLNNVMKVHKILESKGIQVEVIYFHTIKPFDHLTLKNSVRKTKKLITVEELSQHGGIYSESLKHIYQINNLKVRQIAINDFIRNYGSYENLCDVAGLNVSNIFKNCMNIIKK
tara:strand:- start:127 stop:1047 length:921 start_codon:yes stop_codon:yes gene_type:complete